MKRCSKCKGEKQPGDFCKDKSRSDGLQAVCRVCSRVRNAVSVNVNPKAAYSQRKRNLKSLYGVTPEEVGAILVKQGGRCALCGSDSPRRQGSFLVDHDHASGQVRGLLCHPCNSGIGLLGDSPDILAAAILYLRNYGKPLSETSLGVLSTALNIHHYGDTDSGKAN